ncbi:sugar phosphate isomerase/epimerase family protein [Hyphococcus sp. DH-69]|uniref:sugar phosphate isomerase/epimerase family protein n=1 Tax=Hyphococcus formosus TaxID=3143534 RepID=UPI00398BBA50
MQTLKVYQSLWAMQDASGVPITDKERILDRIADAGFSGVSIDVDINEVSDGVLYKPLLEQRNLECQVNIFPRNDNEFVELIKFAKEMDARFCVTVGMVFPLNVSGAIPIIRNWINLAADVGMPLLFETHRNCITNDMFFTLELLDSIPEMNLCGDFSHYVLNRELQPPIGKTFEQLFDRLIQRSFSFQGRVSSHQQIQVPINFPQYNDHLKLYHWLWKRGIESWRRRMSDDDALVFLCELGPPPYAITNADGEELSDRWAEALTIKSRVEQYWRACEP